MNDLPAWLNFVGYAASLLIAISLMMKSLIRLRIINGIGALIFVVYGLMIKAYPVAFLNGLIVIIDLYYLWKMLQRSDYFTMMSVEPDSAYLKFFLDFHHADIQQFFPSFSYHAQPDDEVLFVLRDTVPAGVMIIRPEGSQGTVLLDYALKDFRDFKTGAFIFDDHTDTLIQKGLLRLTAFSDVTTHQRYLQQMGFARSGSNRYDKILTPSIIDDSEL